MSTLQDLRGTDAYSSIIPSGNLLELDKRAGASWVPEQGEMQGRTSSPTLIPLFRPQRSSYLMMSEQSPVTRAPLPTPEYNSPLPLGNHNARKEWKGYCPIPPRGAQCQRGVPWPTWACAWSRDGLSKGESLKKLGWREDPPAQISQKTATLSSLFKKKLSHGQQTTLSTNQPLRKD